MPNKWYNRGRAFEYRVKKDLETIGWTVFRMAGSHTCADLIALQPGKVLLVQCKNASTPYLPPKERKRIRAVAKHLNVMAVVAYRIKRGQIAYSSVLKREEIDAIFNCPKESDYSEGTYADLWCGASVDSDHE